MDRALKEGEFVHDIINNDIYCGTGFNILDDETAEVFTGDEAIMVPWKKLELVSNDDVIREILRLNLKLLELEDALKPDQVG